MRNKEFSALVLLVFVLSVLLPACSPTKSVETGKKKALAVESFLADMAKNIAGDRIAIDSLLPAGIDPHTYEPTPRDGARLAESDIVIINGAELEAWIEPLLQNLVSKTKIVIASDTLKARKVGEGEGGAVGGSSHEVDPHFWLDPLNVLVYIDNIRKAFELVDNAGADYYKKNRDAYSQQLDQLNDWIIMKIGEIPPERRLLVTNHESLGYFADRYGLKIVGTIIPSVSTGTSPSTQQMARLIEQIKNLRVPALFLETGANPQLAAQIERETGARVVLELNTHSVDPGKAGQTTYLEMMRTMVETIVGSLK